MSDLKFSLTNRHISNISYTTLFRANLRSYIYKVQVKLFSFSFQNNVFYEINLQVADSNDNSPIFHNAPYNASISEVTIVK